MSTPIPPPPSETNFILPDRDTLMMIVSHPRRLAILKVLSDGDGYGIGDLAPLVHCSTPNVSRHMLLLKQAGLVSIGRGKLYRLQPYYISEPRKVLDFGHCILRLDVQGG
jgi:DNA-binding transcriptional ArsR family regulator